jgi:glycerol kinase
MNEKLIALDQGTTSSRAILFNHSGEIKYVSQKDFRQIFPTPGWVEHDPNEIWSSQISVAAEIIAKAGISGLEVAAIGTPTSVKLPLYGIKKPENLSTMLLYGRIEELPNIVMN